MSKSLFRQHFCLRLLSNQSKPNGFTLIELLVAMIVGALISGGLLFLVIQLVQTNLREGARSDTQRDLQAAIDYIARDVREAVYVYDSNCLDRPAASTVQCPGLINYLPKNMSGSASNNLPVLAFWRVDQLPQTVKDICLATYSDPSNFTNSQSAPAAIRDVPCLSGRMYTLVVYSLNWDSAPGLRGRARIRRFELPQFTTASASTTPPTPVTGWVDPTRRETDFFTWPLNKSISTTASSASLQTSRPVGANIVLTDFVDRVGLYADSSGAKAQAPLLAGYELTPRRGSSANDEPPRGFYVYVKGMENRGILNQEVVIRIQGDAAGRAGIPNVNPNRPGVPLALETRVLTRGVTGKTD
ncbi:MAG: prepilin-type N-terminal cleavage/methylation domain-containing protein [Leptolyngbya sp. Prado105]|nr:prepilin-type N-terminal cleavage/methylation domain-containing protein [Leptolyngbya sp. Prado105]